MRWLAGILLIAACSVPSVADTVIDAGEQWRTHGGAAFPANPNSPPPAVIPSSSTSNDPTLKSICGCDVMLPKEYLEESTYAFTGRVSESTRSKKGKRSTIFEIDEVFKGVPKPDMKIYDQIAGNECDLPLEEGQSYLVFAKWEWGSVNTSRCMGTKFLEKARVEPLGPSEQLKEKLYIRLRNACMGRHDTPCCLASLKAMRTSYYVPEPEEGCAEETVPDRLHCSGSYTWCIPLSEKTHR